MENVFGYLELAVLGEIFLQIPAPAAVENADKQRPDKVDYQNRDRRKHLLKMNTIQDTCVRIYQSHCHLPPFQRDNSNNKLKILLKKKRHAIIYCITIKHNILLL